MLSQITINKNVKSPHGLHIAQSPHMSESKLKVLHVVSSLNRGGIECWLMNLLRLRRPDVHFDFVVTAPGIFDEETLSLGATVYRLPRRRYVFRYIKKFKRILRKRHYDAVHVHNQFMAGGVLKAAAECGVPIRIAHSHNTGWGDSTSLKIKLIKAWHGWFDLPNVDRYATHLLACSDEAGPAFFGRLWQKNGRGQVVYCGIPTGLFQQTPDLEKRKILCGRFNIPSDAIVVGTLGRLSYQKNHEFLLRVFAELAKRDSRYILFIGGEGELRKETERLVDELSLRDRVRMPGVCTNVPDLLCQLFDVFVLPSRYEGLPITSIESVASGLHMVCSDCITHELSNIVPERFTLLNLSSPLSEWCDAIEAGIGKRETPSEGVALLKQTPFIAENSLNNLTKMYRG